MVIQTISGRSRMLARGRGCFRSLITDTNYTTETEVSLSMRAMRRPKYQPQLHVSFDSCGEHLKIQSTDVSTHQRLLKAVNESETVSNQVLIRKSCLINTWAASIPAMEMSRTSVWSIEGHPLSHADHHTQGTCMTSAGSLTRPIHEQLSRNLNKEALKFVYAQTEISAWHRGSTQHVT